MSRFFILLNEWKCEQLNGSNKLKLSHIDIYAIIFVLGFLTTIFFCLVGVIQLAYLYLGMNSLMILGYNIIPAWIPAISASILALFGLLGVSQDNHEPLTADH